MICSETAAHREESTPDSPELRELKAAAISQCEFVRSARFGHLAVSEGLMADRQVLQILTQQSQGDFSFGEAAVQLGLLGERDIAHLLRFQRNPVEAARERLMRTSPDRGALQNLDLGTQGGWVRANLSVRPRKTRSANIKTTIDTLHTLKPVTACAVEALREFSATNCDIAKAARIIEGDPALVARLLRLANSATFGRSRSVKTTREALVLIGVENTRCILLSAAFFSGVNGVVTPRQKDVWLRSLSGACWAASIAEALNPADRSQVDLAYTAGLLRNLGELTLIQRFPKALQNIDRQVALGAQRSDAEIDELGLSHEDIGALLADRWNLPEEIRGAIWYHHAPTAMVAPIALPKTASIVRSATLVEHVDLAKPAAAAPVLVLSGQAVAYNGEALYSMARERFLAQLKVMNAEKFA